MSELTTEGIIFIIMGWGGVSALMISALTKVLKNGDEMD